jgi:GNAT superfamily N-acetyltransferase
MILKTHGRPERSNTSQVRRAISPLLMPVRNRGDVRRTRRGHYALATGAIAQAAATGRVRRNMPEPAPVMVLGRLAVDRAFLGAGVGSALLRDALLRTLGAAEVAGCRAMLLHAISEDAKRFYVKHGFAESPLDPMTLMIPLADVAKAAGL